MEKAYTNAYYRHLKEKVFLESLDNVLENWQVARWLDGLRFLHQALVSDALSQVYMSCECFSRDSLRSKDRQERDLNKPQMLQVHNGLIATLDINTVKISTF